MERTARRIAWIALWSLTALTAGRSGPGLGPRNVRPRRLTSYDFGTVARGAKVEHRFAVENIYLEDAHIKSAKASCGCTSPEVPAQILKTWQKAYVVAKVDTVHFEGQKDVTIDVEFDKPFRRKCSCTSTATSAATWSSNRVRCTSARHRAAPPSNG